MASTTPLRTRIPWRRSAAAAALLGWVFPGLGHLYVGRPRKGTLFLVAILPTFLLGWHLTGYSIIDPERYGLDFAAQILLGAPTIIAVELSKGLVLEDLPRWFDVGRLYVLIAGLLNLVSVYDVIGEVILHNRAVHELQRARRSEERRPDGLEDTRSEPAPPEVEAPDPNAVPSPDEVS